MESFFLSLNCIISFSLIPVLSCPASFLLFLSFKSIINPNLCDSRRIPRNVSYSWDDSHLHCDASSFSSCYSSWSETTIISTRHHLMCLRDRETLMIIIIFGLTLSCCSSLIWQANCDKKWYLFLRKLRVWLLLLIHCCCQSLTILCLLLLMMMTVISWRWLLRWWRQS